MNRNFLVVFITTFFSLTLFSAEPSAFGAGNLENDNPYGLSSSEKVVLENKNEIRDVIVKSKKQTYKIESFNERIDGLQSVIESLTLSSHQTKLNLQKLEKKIFQDSNTSDEFEKRIDNIIQENSDNIKRTNLALEQLNELVTKIEVSHVSRNDFDNLVNDFNKFKTLLKKEFKVKKAEKTSNKKTLTNWEIFKNAQASFDKKHYTSSINDYKYLIKEKFKPAYAHYMIGEMMYRRKNHSDAIAYFKKSVGLYSKASYMPELMLHTAISMESTGDYKNAKAFYSGVISKYPDTTEAKQATENLNNLD
ncbi:MAG: tetratricopeptide repeat protein [Campylobacterota bacterium]|nr:tetratricopeptide repeat protein [Campylobacterota bacterium]